LESLVRRSNVAIAIEVDPSRLRPSDNPVVLGSAERITAETGWTPRISLEQTLSDLLTYWRQAVARETADRKDLE
ncbi:MAG: GDP-mannose 4,6-dehydratase, partial [Vicinamibacterales bacterium]